MSVLIVDDHELIGTSLELSLRAQGISARRSRAYDLARVLVEAADLEPGVVLLDLDLGRDDDGERIDGVTFIGPLTSRGWRCLILSGSSSQARIGRAIDEGAVGWVPKSAEFPALLDAVHDAIAGRPVMSEQRRAQIVDVYRRHDAAVREVTEKLATLTQRERAVLDLLVNGKRAQAVADHFVVSLATVRTQIRSILGKLGVSSQLEAVAMVRRARGR